MSREIKFRAWDKETKEMSYDFLDKNWLKVCVQSPYVEIMQYTGLKDKNGVEIYEGDIFNYSVWGFRTEKGIVKFGEYDQDGSGGEYEPSKCIGFYVENLEQTDDYDKTVSLLETKDINVIGNIYENPKLIEGID